MAGFDAMMDARRGPMAPLAILGREVTGVVSWNMNDTCNYRCSYCTQRFMPERSYKLQDIRGTLDAFGALPGHWEVKLSGGEPFLQPGLEEIVAGLVDRGHLVSVQTNFSASRDRLLRFLEITSGALHVFAASLHLDFDSPESFLDKARIVQAALTEGASFCVTSVATPERLAELHDTVAPFFERHGISFKVQPEKIHGVLRQYTEAQRDVLRALGGHNRTGEIEPNFRGRSCFAGANYFIIKSSGEAYRCYPASRGNGPHDRLGSFVEGINLSQGPRVCPFNHCGCTVPIERGMIRGIAASPESEARAPSRI
jgi:MoaA/NifB/PqqE/SkfB family radical SAM enzyme